jgi:hypothetical protein
MSSKSKSWDHRSNLSKFVLSSSSRSAVVSATSKEAVRACGINCTLGGGRGEVGEADGEEADECFRRCGVDGVEDADVLIDGLLEVR